ncbi:hypothetical protein GH714_035751 [Hevea brasiliensis]|uniref:Uncharacterized protein n=1 Tax=Hevea brasiliensis TaxID=3981 RepID=A0A6A6L6W8_HEVBR|nr:hypothetical protein GH714_035751 [Hevea brasiliensis]
MKNLSLLTGLHFYNPHREMHSRNKKAMEFIAKGWNALKEVDRVIDYCELNDRRLIPLLRTAKDNFELALEADNSNTHARYWLSKLHLKYHVPGACKAIGAALLVEAADMGDPDAQYELGCRLRVEVGQLASVEWFLCENFASRCSLPSRCCIFDRDCVKKDVASALWCFHRAAEKGHAGAAVAYGSVLLRGAQVPESVMKFNLKRGSSAKKVKNAESYVINPVEMAKEQFQVAARAELKSKYSTKIQISAKFHSTLQSDWGDYFGTATTKRKIQNSQWTCDSCLVYGDVEVQNWDANMRREVVLTAAKLTAEMAVERRIVHSAHESTQATVEAAVGLGNELVRRKWMDAVYASNRLVVLGEVLDKIGFDETVEGQNGDSTK